MSWESRKGKGSYYTRSRRVNGLVVREYVGIGPYAEACAQLDKITREKRKEDRDKIKTSRAKQRLIDYKINELSDTVQTYIHAVLLVSGYHNHKGQWRKKRDDKKRKI